MCGTNGVGQLALGGILHGLRVDEFRKMVEGVAKVLERVEWRRRGRGLLLVALAAVTRARAHFEYDVDVRIRKRGSGRVKNNAVETTRWWE